MNFFKKKATRNVVMLGAISLTVAMSVVFIARGYADSTAINFEAPAYSTGSIQGQNGWGGQTPPGIVINPAAFTFPRSACKYSTLTIQLFATA